MLHVIASQNMGRVLETDAATSLACHSPRACKELDTSDQLNWTKSVNTYEWRNNLRILILFSAIYNFHPSLVGLFLPCSVLCILFWEKGKASSQAPRYFRGYRTGEAVEGRPGLSDPVDTQNLQRLSTVLRFPQTSLSQGHQVIPGSFPGFWAPQ